ncbi:hypothetical protein F4809DRAFT_607985 [Biscogniauxia mediterranea]|nr:hypothetical protein F4809DRAFT_607985 [Biscogniauxia mediterranea]
MSIASESANGTNIKPPRQLEPLTQIRPVTRLASFKYTQDVVQPGHPRHDGHRPSVRNIPGKTEARPSNQAVGSTTTREVSGMNKVDQVRQLIETKNTSASQSKIGGSSGPKNYAKTAQMGNNQTHSLTNQRDGAHTLKQPLHSIKHTKPTHFAGTQDSMMKRPPTGASRRESTYLNGDTQETNNTSKISGKTHTGVQIMNKGLSTSNREAYSKLVNSTFTEKTTDEGKSEEHIPPKGRLLSPPSWLQHPCREAADATARLRHIDTRSHGSLAHSHGYLSNIAVDNCNGKGLTRSKSSTNEHEATRARHDHVADSNREYQQRVAAPSPETALHVTQHQNAES